MVMEIKIKSLQNGIEFYFDIVYNLSILNFI